MNCTSKSTIERLISIDKDVDDGETGCDDVAANEERILTNNESGDVTDADHNSFRIYRSYVPIEYTYTILLQKVNLMLQRRRVLCLFLQKLMHNSLLDYLFLIFPVDDEKKNAIVSTTSTIRI
jgi:hypothetical protein